MTLVARGLRRLGERRADGEWGDSTPPPPGHEGLAAVAAAGNRTDAALRVSTAMSCVLAVSEDIGLMPLRVYRAERGGTVEVTAPPPIVVDPFGYETSRVSAQIGLAQMVVSLLLRGNAYAYVVDVAGGAPVELAVLNPDRVHPQRREDGSVGYRVGMQEVPAAEIVHILGPSLPGACEGMSVIEYQRTTFGTGTAVDDYALGWFERGVAPSGLLKYPGRALNRKEARQLRDQFMTAHAGVGRSHGVGVISGGVEYQPLSLKPEDAQFLELKGMLREDICGLFGVPPYRVGVRGENTSQGGSRGLDAQGQDYRRHTLLRWTSRLEFAWTRMIPDPRTSARFDFAEFARPDAQTRWRNHLIGRTVGAVTNNEIRAAEGMPPLADSSADDPMAPLNSAHATAGDAGPGAGTDQPPNPQEGQ